MNSNWFKLVMKMTKVEYGKNILLKGSGHINRCIFNWLTAIYNASGVGANLDCVFFCIFNSSYE